eukprot:COSAG03_NODE_3758_length_1843_cov_9.004014_1_plen_65_part_00
MVIGTVILAYAASAGASANTASGLIDIALPMQSIILLPFTLDLPALSRNADPSFSSTKSLKCLA